MLGLPPLKGGHVMPSAPPPPPPDDPNRPRRGPSKKRRSSRAPPADGAPWEAARSWVRAAFDERHALLLPQLTAYLEGGSSSKRCSSLESFLQAFYVRQQSSATAAVGAAANFLVMESWRAAWLTRDASRLPSERRAARALMDPLLDEAATKVANAPQRLHRESVEFREAVVEEASRALRASGAWCGAAETWAEEESTRTGNPKRQRTVASTSSS